MRKHFIGISYSMQRHFGIYIILIILDAFSLKDSIIYLRATDVVAFFS